MPGPLGGAANIAITDEFGEVLYDYVIPAAPEYADWQWNENPGWWIASKYRYQGRLLEVVATVSRDLTRCETVAVNLWSGGSQSTNRILGPAPVAFG